MKVHAWLREELAGVRDATTEGASPTIDRLLQVRCLAFCDALDAHHAGEDDGIFPHLENEHPELAPALARLRSEHQVVAGILREVRHIVVRAESEGPEGDIRTRLDQLSAELETHFAYEEEQLVDLLNQARTHPWDQPN